MLQNTKKIIIKNDSSGKFFKIVWLIFAFSILLLAIGFNSVSTDTFHDWMKMVGGCGAFLCAVCLTSGAIICVIMSIFIKYFIFKFKSQGVWIWGYIQKFNSNSFAKDSISFSYLEFSVIKLDVAKILSIMTGSGRILLKISLKDANKRQIEEILYQFQHIGKRVEIAPELYGLYSVGGEN